MNNVFLALSHPVRRQVLKMLRQGPMSAGAIAEAFDVSKPTMSGHFKALREACLIQADRQGTTIYYRLNTSVVEEAAAAVLDLVQQQKGDAR